MKKIILYINTIKYLKFIQIIYRVYYKIIPTSLLTPKHVEVKRISKINKISHPCKKKSTYQKNSIVTLNKSIPIPDGIWESENASKLENYNLNYFDFITDIKNPKEGELLINKWISDNIDYNTIPWHAYPVSLRIINWIKFLSLNNISNTNYDNNIYKQTDWLTKNLEYHLLGNHLFVNAKALLFSGFYLNSEQSDRYIEQGTKIFNKEIKEQLLDDGGSFELSPMYHAIMLEDLLDIYNIINTSPKRAQANKLLDSLYHTIKRMFLWLETMTHISGKYAHFNDSSSGVAPTLNELKQYADRLNLSESYIKSLDKKSVYLSNSGYCRLENDHAYVICDGANVGPDYIPGHAHADTLSFEMSINDIEIFVNSGTSEYGISEERHRQRSTASHNTAEINNQNSSEVWAGFRVARRAKIISANFNKDEQQYSASHNGYHRLNNQVTHKRSWTLHDKSLKICDNFSGKSTYSTSTYFHLHPDITPNQTDSNKVTLKYNNSKICTLIFDPRLDIEISRSTYHPGFGETEENKVITFKYKVKDFEKFDFSVEWE